MSSLKRPIMRDRVSLARGAMLRPSALPAVSSAPRDRNDRNSSVAMFGSRSEAPIASPAIRAKTPLWERFSRQDSTPVSRRGTALRQGHDGCVHQRQRRRALLEYLAFRWPQMDLLEGGLRVPRIAWWPGRFEAGQVTDQVCITMDLTATCLAAAGLVPDENCPLDGQNLLPVLTGQTPAGERALFWRMANRSQRAVRRGGWKYLNVRNREFLYIEYDPRERGDLAREHPDRLNEMRSLWEGWNETMWPMSESMIPPLSNLQDMLW